MDWLEAMPAGVQVAAYVLVTLTAMLGTHLRAERLATDKARHDVVGMYSQALDDMKTRMDGLQADVTQCEQDRRVDRQAHAEELAGLRERHAREIGELQGQITTLTALLRQGPRP